LVELATAPCRGSVGVEESGMVTALETERDF
jgi:hypothetical protein